MRGAIPFVLGLFILGVTAGCADPVKSRLYPALGKHDPIERLAMAPLAIGSEGVLASPSLELGGRMVARHLAEAFEARGVEVIPAEDVKRLLSRDRLTFGKEHTPQFLAKLVAERFGADALLTGQVRRYVERGGEAVGSRRPASVAFDLVLRSTPSGERLWSMMFDETQKPLTENIFGAGRYPGGGTRWLTASELARWGAVETVRSSPLDQ